MSNFSNIGFNISSEQELRNLVEKVYPKSYERNAPNGIYFQYSDPSGAELWIQINNQKEVVGVNPHFNGESIRHVKLTASIERPESILDGAYHCWAKELEEESELFPFVFDVPDYDTDVATIFPRTIKMQLTAFTREISYFEDADKFMEEQGDEFKWAARSFIPSGLFNPGEEAGELGSAEAIAIFSGDIVEVKKKLNQQTGIEFYWLLVNTLGGAVDVVADLRYFKNLPSIGGIIHGQFWLSGRFAERKVKKEKGFFRKLFG